MFDSIADSAANAGTRASRERVAQIGLWQSLASPSIAELCATAGFDRLLLDGEHAPSDLRSVLAQRQDARRAAIADHESSTGPAQP